VAAAAPAPAVELAEELRTSYYEGARWVDAQLRELVATLERHGALENTVLIVTSDHGESFGEHGMLGHSRQLYDEMLRVPLVIVGPDFPAGTTIDESVGLVDVLATFMEVAGLHPLDDIDGRSLMPVVRGSERGRPVLAQEVCNYGNTRQQGDVLLTSVRSDHRKYVLRYALAEGLVVESLFDLERDPMEMEDLLEGAAEPPAFEARACDE
jgi:arylsulfatase A-like enzyme